MSIFENYAHLRELEEKRSHLMQKLEISMKLMEFYPDAFVSGATKLSIHGSTSTGFFFKVERGDGVVTTWPVRDVPEEVLDTCPSWGREVRNLQERYEHRKKLT